MKKVFIALVSLLVLVSFSSCLNVVVKAPAGKKISISSQEPSIYSSKKMVFYVLWGLVPITDNSTADLMLTVPDGSEVAVKTEMTLIDFLVSAFLGVVTIQSHTVSVGVVK